MVLGGAMSNRQVDDQFKEEVNGLHAQICGGLADPSRILILYALADHPYYVTELAEALDIPQPTVSRHLKVLRDRGMVKAQRERQTVLYSLEDDRIIEALDLLRAVLADMLKEQGALGEHVSLDGSP